MTCLPMISETPFGALPVLASCMTCLVMISETPFGALPVLVFPDGKMIGHSGCIARAVAHECGLVGKDKKETVLADMVAETIIEIREGSLAPLFLEKDEAKKVSYLDMHETPKSFV